MIGLAGLPTHGVDGWQLAEYDFDELTGVATYLYEHPAQPPRVVERGQFVSAEYHDRVRDERQRDLRRRPRMNDDERNERYR